MSGNIWDHAETPTQRLDKLNSFLEKNDLKVGKDVLVSLDEQLMRHNEKKERKESLEISEGE
tara:strand:- start:380 stop:565 length:186 start_codon:yes stop_codon:yes gene_type:complete